MRYKYKEKLSNCVHVYTCKIFIIAQIHNSAGKYFTSKIGYNHEFFCPEHLPFVVFFLYTDRTRIYFMYRNCSIPDTFDCGISCCVNDSMHDYTCQDHCRDDLCNNVDESARLMRSQAHMKDPGSGALSVLHKFIRMTVCMGLLFTIIFKSIFIDSNIS